MAKARTVAGYAIPGIIVFFFWVVVVIGGIDLVDGYAPITPRTWRSLGSNVKPPGGTG